MHPFLMKQNLDYGIYIVEPLKELTFNRALLMNIGYLESLKMTNEKWDCFMFHDVDLIPEDERNIYSCPQTPRHVYFIILFKQNCFKPVIFILYIDWLVDVLCR